ncbi:hypothetical protein UFOVP119_35 [uncultured Caudovirales phage]|uniref:Uncharacterized protein n=1 Tax=uncultured Caudovirales phage TaxID=2100421 RepID=A0A6J5L7K1_9CAUD|nr:hypothetical protein UFOVP119_35 [uncultured Caudovirales phage]
MASVWIQPKDEKHAKKHAGMLTIPQACTLARVMVKKWPGPVVKVFDFEWLMYRSEGDRLAHKPAALLYVESHSPPPNPEDDLPKPKAART